MKLKSALAIGLLGLTACGGTKTVYVVNTEPEQTEAPETTVRVTTTDAPIAVAPSDEPYRNSDERIFLASFHSMYTGYLVLNDEELLNLGYTMCGAMDNGYSLETVVNAIIYEYPNMSQQDQDFVSAVLASAIINLCPQHEWQIPR